MSLTVNHLNADSTFLLTFSPHLAPASSPTRFPGTFTILVDPWLDGHYTVWRPSFAIAYHTKAPSIPSLANLPHPIDMILVSQDKSDHCHRETLCSLPRDTQVPILATRAAAKKIWSWKYFIHPDIVRIMPPYKASQPDTVIRLPVDPHSPTSAPGEVTITNMPSKLDMANLHNAIGITYHPPSALVTSTVGRDTVDLTKMPIMTTSMPRLVKKITSHSSLYHEAQLNAHSAPTLHVSNRQDGDGEKVLSVLYSPHGVSPSTIKPYVTNHLYPLNGARPLTALFHSMTVEANPWYMGGIVNAGAPGGAKLAKALRAKHWISAHDEVKDCSGMAIRFIRTEQFDIDTVHGMLNDDVSEKVVETEVSVLGCGEERRYAG